jgi:hypothetical protein
MNFRRQESRDEDSEGTFNSSSLPISFLRLPGILMARASRIHWGPVLAAQINCGMFLRMLRTDLS